MSKRYTVDETWELCLKMYKDVSDRVGTAGEATVTVMKIQWLSENDPDSNLSQHCYFCQYDFQNGDECCDVCPGKLVDKSFHCGTASYYWRDKPRQFYAELKRLNKIRLENK